MSKFLVCAICGKAGTKEEAEQRNFNVGRCAYCGGELKSADHSIVEKPDSSDEVNQFIEVLDIIDGWYHEHTRHHLVDVDGSAKAMIERVVALIASEKPDGDWWVTNHDAPENNKRVSGPYSTSSDAAKARALLERFEHHHNYWIERIASLKDNHSGEENG